MSYILEALKKAQAERQLGAPPTIHAPVLQSGASGAGAATRKPVYFMLVGLACLVMALSLFIWPQPWRGAASPVSHTPSAGATAAGTAPTPPALVRSASPATSVVTASSSSAASAMPVMTATPVASTASTVSTASTTAPAAPITPAASAAPAPSASARAKVIAAPHQAPVVAVAKTAPARPAPPSPAEDDVASLRDLPEPIQRLIPPLALGGYIYSKNPADRILLVDKVLRHEGEEVAPGVTLEMLQPKAAVFSFKGYRYRVAY